MLEYLERLEKPLKIESLWRWRSIAISIHKSGCSLQSGTVAVERAWDSIKCMLPGSARCVGTRLFTLLMHVAYIRHNLRLFKAKSNPTLSNRDSIITEALHFFGTCQQSAGGLEQLFEAFDGPWKAE